MYKKRKDFLVFGAPLIEEPEIKEITDILRSGWIGTGPKAKRFEEMFRRYKLRKYAIALNSCTAALHLSIRAIDIQNGDEVILPSMTFAGTANAVIHAGGRPVFADCRRDTMTIDPEDIRRKITSKTKAIIPVHFAGRPCDMDEILAIAKRYRLKVIEDCAHAIEAEYKGKKIGTLGDLACFSFYVTKNITTCEGGMVITDDSAYSEKIKIRAMQGLAEDAWTRFSDKSHKHYEVVCDGYKCNMTDLQAVIGIHQLPRIDKYWRRRKEIWGRYDEAFRDLPLAMPLPVAPGDRHALHLYTLLLDIDNLKMTRDCFLKEMIKRNIGISVHYIALHLHPYYRNNFGYRPGDFPNAEWISERTVSLPLSPKLAAEDVEDVISAVVDIVGHGKNKNT